MSTPTVRPSGRTKSFGAAILLVALLLPDTTVVHGARLLLQGGPAAVVEKTSTTPEDPAPSKPEFRPGFPATPPGSTCEAAQPRLVELSQVMMRAWDCTPCNASRVFFGICFFERLQFDRRFGYFIACDEFCC